MNSRYLLPSDHACSCACFSQITIFHSWLRTQKANILYGFYSRDRRDHRGNLFCDLYGEIYPPTQEAPAPARGGMRKLLRRGVAVKRGAAGSCRRGSTSRDTDITSTSVIFSLILFDLCTKLGHIRQRLGNFAQQYRLSPSSLEVLK
jgi:hypothetical protein